jgi:hypothetical protein
VENRRIHALGGPVSDPGLSNAMAREGPCGRGRHQTRKRIGPRAKSACGSNSSHSCRPPLWTALGPLQTLGILIAERRLSASSPRPPCRETSSRTSSIRSTACGGRPQGWLPHDRRPSHSRETCRRPPERRVRRRANPDDGWRQWAVSLLFEAHKEPQPDLAGENPLESGVGRR